MASMISSVIGGFTGAASSYNRRKVEHDIARFNTQVYAANARAAAARAKYELLLHSRNVRRTLGTQRAMFAAAGVETEGTPLAIMMETAGMGAEKARILKYRGDVEEAEWINRARMSRYGGKVAFKAGQMGAISSIIGGISQAGASAAKGASSGASWWSW